MGDLEPDVAVFGRGLGRAVGVLDCGLCVGRLTGFGREVGVLVPGAVRVVGRFAGFDRAVGVLLPGVVRAVGRFTGFDRARGAGLPSRWPAFGDGLEAVGCSRVCLGRAILR